MDLSLRFYEVDILKYKNLFFNMKGCIFCEIAKGKEKSWTIYEDNLVKAFFDMYPVAKGHTLVISKKHYRNIYDIPEKELKRIIVVAKRLVKVYKKVLGIKSVNIIHCTGTPAGQDIFHFHVHIIPRHNNDDLKFIFPLKTEELRPKFDKLLNRIKKAI